MEDYAKLIESLLEKATEYGKTSFELVKLKALDKTTDVISSLVSHSVALVFFSIFFIFLNLGLSFWLGEILGKTWLGFLFVAGFYFISGLLIHFFLHKRFKKLVSDYIIKKILK